MIVPSFDLELHSAYQAVCEAGAAIDHHKRPDLHDIIQDVQELMRSL
jgi:hypothetical protein